MKKCFLAAAALAGLTFSIVPVVGQQAPAVPAPAQKKLEVLFLGHAATHHPSDKYEPMLAAALASEPFHFTYSTDPKDLNDANLAKFDELIIYANHDKIEPDQEKALLDFVASGKGFIPLHCASFCFQNSPQYIALVGAQFQKHKTGEFVAEITKPDSQVLLGIQPFNVWDETYVHSKHNNDRTVIMERVDETGREPWTWTRTHGKGKVFYTAYGHDERVWGHPMFQRLVRNAIYWAAPAQKVQAMMLQTPERRLAAAFAFPFAR